MSVNLTIEDILDLDTYPVHDRANPEREKIISRCKADLEENMFCCIPALVRPRALDAMAREAETLRNQAFDNNSRRNVYLQRQSNPDLPKEHARNIFNSTSTRMIAYDQIAVSSPLKTFYHANEVRELIAGIVGADALYDNDDPYQPANYVCYDEGDRSSWHFDSDSQFTFTLMVQAADVGGEFQMSPDARSDSDQNYNHVAQVLRGKRNETIVSVGREPGALCIFSGCNALHRVSEVRGNTMRIMGVFVYESEPGILGDPEINATIYGPRVGVG